jgi:hypothetical protein
MNKNWSVVLALCGAGLAQAQESGLSVSVGARAWYTEWTTFSYFAPQNVNLALTQVSATNKLVLVPVVSVRYGDFVGSFSAVPSTRFSFADGGSGTRREFDANVGYALMPGLAVTLGYKKVSQRDGASRYEPGGPVAGLSANAQLDGPFSVYGALGLGRLKTPTSDDPNVVQFKADYRLTELGLAYGLNADRPLRRWTFTTGYRIQVMSSKEAFGSQDGRDTTQGFTFGAVATF